MPEDVRPRLLTVRKAAEMVRVSRAVVYAAIAAGQLPHAVVGGVIHVHADTFDAWVRQRRNPAPSVG